MKTRFWNVGIKMYADGTVQATVLGSREAAYQPSATYRKELGREVFSFWYETEAMARSAVLEALAMNKKQEVAA